MKKRALLFSFFCLMITSIVTAQIDETTLAKAVELRENFKEDDSLVLFEQLYKANPKHYETVWSLSILYARVGYRMESEKKQIELYKKAKTFAEQALAIDSVDYNSNYAMGVAMGRIALISGARDRVAASKDIKKYADRSVKANPANAGGWHMLSRWNHRIANLNFAERAAANLLFGGAPEGASNEQAIATMKKAIELDPNFILYKRDFANILADLDMEKEAIKYAEEVLKMPIRSLDDPKYKEEMKKLIKDLK